MPAVLDALTTAKWNRYERAIREHLAHADILPTDPSHVRTLATNLLDNICAVTRGGVEYTPAGYKTELLDGAASLLAFRIEIKTKHTRDTATAA